MSMSKQIISFVKKKPVIMNSFVYGSFYTIAEFLQQTYKQKEDSMKLKEQLSMETPVASSQSTFKSPGTNLIEASKLSIEKNSFSSKLDSYNWPVLQRYVVYGYFMAGPILHNWYVWLDRIFVGTAARTIVKKLFCDQFILTPPLLVLFFTSMSLMEGKKDIFGECKAKFVNVFQTSCLYWLPVQFFNFLIVPSALRVVFVSVASFLWVNILCHLKRTPIVIMENEKINNK